MKHHIPEKPTTQKEQISMLWDAVYNHIFTRLGWQDIKINFILAIIAIVMVLVSIVLVVMLTGS